MSDPLEEFAEWAEIVSRNLPSSATANVVCSGDAAYFEIEQRDGALGRLIYWRTRAADATVFDPNGKMIDLRTQVNGLGGWERVQSLDFDRAFAPFVMQFAEGRH